MISGRSGWEHRTGAAKHPESKGTFLVIAGEIIVRSHERFLGEVFSISAVTEYPVANVKY